MPVTPEDVALAHRLAARYRNYRHSNAEDDDLTSDALLALTLAVEHWDMNPAVRETVNRAAFLVRRVNYALIDGLRARHGREFARQHFQEGMLRLDTDGLSDVLGGEDNALEVLDGETAVNEQLDSLPPREREIVARTLQGETLAAVGKSLGITEGRVCQLRLRALDRLRGGEHPPDKPAWNRADLSAREIEVLVRIAEGDSNTEAGVFLYVTEETIKTHSSHILGKLHARNRTHAVALGFRSGLLH